MADKHIFHTLVSSKQPPKVRMEKRNNKGVLIEHPLESNFITRFSHDPLHQLVAPVWEALGLDPGENASIFNEVIIGSFCIPWLDKDSPYLEIVDVTEAKAKFDFLYFYFFNYFKAIILQTAEDTERQELEELFGFDISKSEIAKAKFLQRLNRFCPDYNDAVNLLFNIEVLSRKLSQTMLENDPLIFDVQKTMYHGKAQEFPTLFKWNQNPFSIQLPGTESFYDLKMKIYEFVRTKARQATFQNRQFGIDEIIYIFPTINNLETLKEALKKFKVADSSKYYVETSHRDVLVFTIVKILYPELTIPSFCSYTFICTVDYSEFEWSENVKNIIAEAEIIILSLRRWPWIFLNDHSVSMTNNN